MSTPIRVGFAGFGEVNSPDALIEEKLTRARQSLESLGLEVISTPPIRDDPLRHDETRAREVLSQNNFDALVVCLAGWIPSHTVIDVISPFIHHPVILWGLTGYYEGDRLVTTADQAGTTALRDTLDALGFHFKYIYDTPDAPYAAAQKVFNFAKVAHAARRLRGARVGMMGFRDMRLHATLFDGVSLRRVVGVEVESFETLEVVQRMEQISTVAIDALAAELISSWKMEGTIQAAALEQPLRMYLAVMDVVHERGFEAVSLIDVDGVKKLLHFPPGLVLSLLADRGGVASIPENDAPGAVTQLIVRYLTGQVGAYFEFYEFFSDRLLVGVPDFVPAEVIDGPVRVRLAKFGQLADGVLNVSRVKTGRVTLCRLAGRGDHYRMHIITGNAVSPRPWEEAGWEQPAPQLPGLEILPDVPVDDFAQKVLGQHYILAYGDQRASLTDLCRLLGIEVI